MSAGDWTTDFEAAVLEALAGRRQFPVTFVLRAVPTAGELTEAAERAIRLDSTLEVEHLPASGGGEDQDLLVVRAGQFDPEPPPLLEGHPMPRDGMMR